MRLKHEGRLSLILFMGFVALLAVCLYGCASTERDMVYARTVGFVASEHARAVDAFETVLAGVEQTPSVVDLRAQLAASNTRVAGLVLAMEDDVRRAAALDTTGEILRLLEQLEARR